MEGSPAKDTLMMQTISPLKAIASTATFWMTASVLVGLVANQLPMALLSNDTALTRDRGIQESKRNGIIQKWKKWIPDAGAVLPGGISKKSLAKKDSEALLKLIAEAHRAEIVHYVLWLAALLTAYWLPPVGVTINIIFASIANGPCLILQRHTRQRVQRIIAIQRLNNKKNQKMS